MSPNTDPSSARASSGRAQRLTSLLVVVGLVVLVAPSAMRLLAGVMPLGTGAGRTSVLDAALDGQIANTERLAALSTVSNWASAADPAGTSHAGTVLRSDCDEAAQSPTGKPFCEIRGAVFSAWRGDYDHVVRDAVAAASRLCTAKGNTTPPTKPDYWDDREDITFDCADGSLDIAFTSVDGASGIIGNRQLCDWIQSRCLSSPSYQEIAGNLEGADWVLTQTRHVTFYNGEPGSPEGRNFASVFDDDRYFDRVTDGKNKTDGNAYRLDHQTDATLLDEQEWLACNEGQNNRGDKANGTTCSVQGYTYVGWNGSFTKVHEQLRNTMRWLCSWPDSTTDYTPSPGTRREEASCGDDLYLYVDWVRHATPDVLWTCPTSPTVRCVKTGSTTLPGKIHDYEWVARVYTSFTFA